MSYAKTTYLIFAYTIFSVANRGTTTYRFLLENYGRAHP
jgi:hypothetical protein